MASNPAIQIARQADHIRRLKRHVLKLEREMKKINERVHGAGKSWLIQSKRGGEIIKESLPMLDEELKDRARKHLSQIGVNFPND